MREHVLVLDQISQTAAEVLPRRQKRKLQSIKMNEYPKILLPKDLSSFLPSEYELYEKLIGIESKLNKEITRKRRMMDSSLRVASQTKTGTLRLQIFVRYHNPFWTLRIQGRLLDQQSCSSKFSTFFRKIVIELDNKLYNDSTIEWARYRSPCFADGFEVTREGTEEQEIEIKIFQSYNSEHCAVSKQLEAIVSQYLNGKKEETRQNIAIAVWQYIKEHNLLSSEKFLIVNDSLLITAFGCKEMQLSSVLSRIQQHLLPVSPISLKLRLKFDRIDEEILLDERELDIEVAIDEVLNTIKEKCIHESKKVHEDSIPQLQLLDNQIIQYIKDIEKKWETRNFMLKFCNDPCGWTKEVLREQVNSIQDIQEPKMKKKQL